MSVERAAVLEPWEDCERDYGQPHEWRWANFQNFQLGGQECRRCPATRAVTDWPTLRAGRTEIVSLGGTLPPHPTATH